MKYSITEELPGIWFIDLEVDDEEEYIGSYVLSSGTQVALIEVGPESTFQKILRALNDIGLTYEDVKYLFLTHVHLDHAGAAGNLIKYFPNAIIVTHQKGKQHLVDPEAALWRASRSVLGFVADIYGKPESVPGDRVTSVGKRRNFYLGELSFEIIPTPGHASHHVCIFIERERILFPGDAAGIYVPSLDVLLPISPPPFRLDLELKSIETMIALKPRLIAYTHFGISSNATKKLHKYYRQLILWHEITKEIIAKGIKDRDEMLEYISKHDRDLSKYLANSKGLLGIKRSVKSGIEGFLELVDEEKKEGQVLG